MFKKDIDERHLRVYELYVQRVMKEGDLIWSRFKIYFSFISGILVILGYLMNIHINESYTDPNLILWILFLLSFIGAVFTVLWFFINKNGHEWQERIDRVIIDVEDYIFIPKYILNNKGMNKKKAKKYALYQRLHGFEAPPHFRDVVVINNYICLSFFCIFLFIGIWSLEIIL